MSSPRKVTLPELPVTCETADPELGVSVTVLPLMSTPPTLTVMEGCS